MGGHRQTLLGYWRRRGLRWGLPAQDLVVPVDREVKILARASWQPGRAEERPAVVLVHGLGGWDGAPYAVATGLHAWSCGWHVVRMNMRGSGGSVSLCPYLYNAGLDSDVLAVLEAVARHASRVAVIGFSLGGSIALLAAGRNRARLPSAVRGLVAISAPLDLAPCSEALARPANLIYDQYFLRHLKRAYQERQERNPEYERGREKRVRSLHEYDEAITAPYGGYASVAEYYARSSPGPWLTAIERPTLVLAAADDPIVPLASIAAWPLPASGLVRRELLHTGGHLGFVAATAAPGGFWAAERALDFLSELGGAAPHPPDPRSLRGSESRFARSLYLWACYIAPPLLRGDGQDERGAGHL